MRLDKCTCVYKWDPSVRRISAGFIYCVFCLFVYFPLIIVCIQMSSFSFLSCMSCFKARRFSILWASQIFPCHSGLQMEIDITWFLYYFSLLCQSTHSLSPGHALYHALMANWCSRLPSFSFFMCWGTSEMISRHRGESCSPRDGCAVFFSFHSQRCDAGGFSVGVHVQIVPVNASAHAWAPKQAAHVCLSHVTSRTRHS